jgi:hypothetical protein
MLIVIALALVIGVTAGWIYAGCPVPRVVTARLRSRPAGIEAPPAVDGVSPAPVPGASPAQP